VLLVLLAPGFEHLNHRVKRVGVGQDLVLHYHGRAGAHGADNELLRFQVLQLLGQHFGGDAGHAALQPAKVLGTCAQRHNDGQLPFAVEYQRRVAQGAHGLVALRGLGTSHGKK